LLLTLPDSITHWSMTTMRDRLVKIGAKIVRHGRSVTFQMAEVMVSRGLFEQILDCIAALRRLPPARF
jgi:hypothetical protein